MRLNAVVAAMIAALALLAGTGHAADDLAGRYASTDGAGMQLDLRESGGSVSGTLSGDGVTMRLEGRREGDRVAGNASMEGMVMPFRATLQGSVVQLELADPEYSGEWEALVFSRADTTPSQPSGEVGGAAAAGGTVVINGQALSEADLARAGDLYGLGIPPGDYWYDPVLGAWGVRGSPTLGFIAPGLALGGELRADASGGGTGIFVNGRELHAHDVLALQQITGPIVPGRYFITAEGLAGPEHGPVLWNLRAMVAQAGGGGGSSNTWQSRITGASGFSDGNTGAVFLPNGGIVSYGN